MLVADNGPLGSFYSRIAMGYALGIHDNNMRNDLNIVRNIRNAFAHSRKSIQFDHPAVAAELGKATRSAKTMWKSIGPDAMRYKSLCFYLSAKLVRMYESTRYDPAPDYVKALLSGML
jgi:DNA-binding MltR family transcriptional regulator